MQSPRCLTVSLYIGGFKRINFISEGIVHVTRINVIWLFLISGILAAIFLIAYTPDITMAYSCSSSSSAQTHIQSSVSGSSGSCSSGSSATSTPGPKGSAVISAIGPPTSEGEARICTKSTPCSATVSGQTAAAVFGIKTSDGFSAIIDTSPGHVSGKIILLPSSSGVQSTTSTSAGGSQSSCSSSVGTAATGSTSSTSVSKPGHCP